MKKGAFVRDRVPAAPLLPFLRLAGRWADEPVQFESNLKGTVVKREARRVGIRQLSRMYAERYDRKEENVNRWLWRILSGKQASLDPYDADRLCVLIGLHPALVWPDEWPVAAA